MKKLLLTLFVIVCIIGCADQVKQTLPQKPQRLTVESECDTDTWGPHLYIIKDNDHNREYLVAKFGEAISICPVIIEVNAEKVEQ